MPSRYSLKSADSDFSNPIYKSGNQETVIKSKPHDQYVSVQQKAEEHEVPAEPEAPKDGGKKARPPMVGVAETFKFSTCRDRLLMLLGTICACAHGAATPVMIMVFGNMADMFITSGDYEQYLAEHVPIWVDTCVNMTWSGLDPCGNITVDYILNDPSPPDRLLGTCDMLLNPEGCQVINDTELWDPSNSLTEQMSGYSIIYVIIGCCVLIVAYLQTACWQTAAYNQTQRIRTRLFWAILRQEISWFDTHDAGELNTRLSDDVEKIESGIGDKMGLLIQYVATFIAAIVVAFVHSWKLTLVILSISPLLFGCAMAIGKIGSSMTRKELKAYAKAGAVAEEVLVAIRTVMAFGGESKECARYNSNLLDARNFGMKKGLVSALSVGATFFCMFGSYALGFWYGSKLVFDDEIPAGNLLIVFFSVITGTFTLGTATPNVQDFASARGAAYVTFNIIDHDPDIDSTSTKGHKDVKLTGNVEFHDVHFNYPSRMNVKVLQGLSLQVRVGQTVALVGSSGCGKSTTVQLLQRFYDPQEGKVTIDGKDIREFNVKWLRQQVGVVSQEPVLFATTIAENVRYGQDGISTDDIIQACKEANAHDFIMKLPKQYDTLVGERGAQLSGGQKQRIAIARALVRNPKVLLLDEATSALDTESEATVQAALDVARQGRTTLVIAHRLSTIRTADVIIGVKDGRVQEQGTHEELMAKKGLYHELVINQQAHFDDEDDGDKDEMKDDEIALKPGLERALSIESVEKRLRSMSSLSRGSLTDKQNKDKEESVPIPSMKRIIRANAPEWPYILLGCFGSLIAGGVQPAVAVVFSEFIGIFTQSGPEVQDKVNLYAGMFAVIGFGAALGVFTSNLCFSRSGEHLTMRMRQLSFQSLLRQEMSYFDDHDNNVGALCTRLATDASAVQGATGHRLGTFCQSASSVGAGIIIGFMFSWELTLLILGFIPFLLASGFIHMRVMSGNTAGKKIALETAGKIAVEAVENMRTVATLTKEQKFLDDYERETLQPFRDNKRKVHVQAISFGFSQCIMFFANAACFRLGAFLVVNRGLQIKYMFRVFSAVAFGAISAGRASSFAPDYGKAKVAAGKLFALFDRVPEIDSSNTSGKKLTNCEGTISLKNVQFNYPSRPNVPVLKGLDLTVSPGQTVALVGSSGCGKSTTVQLLERFYDPLQGTVRVEGEDIRDLNLQWLRSQMGIVSQEPILFDASIRENIAYGDNSRDVSMAEIIEAAKNANIHSFIENLPRGYDTNVGDKGAQLSGGQKQRVAIARALVRNPKVLLLDEATSALDTESEKVVQAALDRAQEGRTCIVIAHRLSTVQNADCIVVIHHGKVVEMGTHQELLQQRGRYYKLNNTQLKKAT